MKIMGKIIGIDLGTTNSVVAIMEGKEPKVIVNEEGSRLTPSVVGIDEKGEVMVGQIARRQAIMNPEATVYSIKRFMGRRLEEVSEEIKRVVLPERNQKDVVDVPDQAKNEVDLVFIRRMDEVLPLVLRQDPHDHGAPAPRAKIVVAESAPPAGP